MLDKNKIILVIYVNIENLKDADVAPYMNQLTQTVVFDNSILRLFIPIRKGETRIECINPKRISDEDYTKVSEIVEKADKVLNDILNNTNNGTE